MVIKSSRKRWARNVVFVEEIRNTYKILVGKPDALRRHRRVCEDNIKTDLKK
jgi:hypothetical protein